MKEENKFYNYIYLDPTKPGEYKYNISDTEQVTFNHEPFYIGKGCGRRCHQHKYKKYSGRFMKSKMLNFDKNSIKPEIVILNSNKTSDECLKFEKLMIDIIGRRDLNKGTLVNLTDGGEGCLRRKQSKKEKLKRSNSLRGRITTIEARKNIVKGKGSNFILQYDVNGNFIKEWYSIRDAKRNGFKGLGHALFKNRNMSGGYLWFKKLSDEIPIKIDSYIPHNKTLNKYKKLIANGN